VDNLSTSSANLDLVRSIYAAWERGDFTSADWAHPQIECVVIGGVLGDKVTGLAGFAEAWRGWLDAWKNFRAGAEEYRDLGESVRPHLLQRRGQDERTRGRRGSDKRCERVPYPCVPYP
jgi:hypothetical protein